MRLLMLLVITSLVAAASVTAEVVSNTTTPISGTFVNPCNGETVTLDGVLHAQFRVTVDGNGGIHVGVHINIHESGTGNTTGAKYSVDRTQDDQVNGSVSPLESTSTINIPIIAQGNVPNFTQKITFHFTINANGEVTSSIANFDSACH